MKNNLIAISLVTVLITSCSSSKNYTASIGNTPAYKQYKIDSLYKKDTALVAFLKPYKEEVARQMNVVIGETVTPLERKTPEGTLGNFAVDAMLQMAKATFKRNVDAAIINHDGLRLDEIGAGPITLGTMYELMPFDNEVVLLLLTGQQLQQFLDLVALKGGWPLANLKMEIKDGKAYNVLINGKSLIDTATYTIATTDYTAKGNEGATMLKDINRLSTGYLFRNALIDYVKEQTGQGKKINTLIESRITNVK